MPIPALTLTGLKDGTPANETDSTIPLNELRTAINDMLAGDLSWEQFRYGAQSLTIASDAVTATYSYIVVDTEGAAASDNLSTINGGQDGDVIFIRSANAGRVVTLITGGGNVVLNSGNNAVLSPTSIMMLFRVGAVWHDVIPINLSPITDPGVFNARLTGVTNGPYAEGGGNNIFLTPINGGIVTLYNGVNWTNYTLTEITIPVSTKASDGVYDLFLYDSGGGVLAIEFSTAWTSGTSRVTALGQQDGVWVKGSDHTRRFVGTFHNNNGTQCLDQNNRRGIWNMYNRVYRPLTTYDATSHAWATAAWQSWDPGTGDFSMPIVNGSPSGSYATEPFYKAFITATWGTTATAGLGLMLDWVSGSPTANFPFDVAGLHTGATGQYWSADGFIVVAQGKHRLFPLEFGGASITFANMQCHMDWWC